MKLAVGLTPAWQHILEFDRFRVDAVNRATAAHWAASGKILNVGIALHRLGGPSKTLTVLGGPPYDRIDSEFDALGVPRRWVRTAAETRVCTTIIDRSAGRDGRTSEDGDIQMTELVENGRSLAPGDLEALEDAYAEEVRSARVVVLTGSIPPGTDPSCFRRLLDVTECPAILDLRGDELSLALEGKPFVVKPNVEELERTVGKSIRTDAELDAAIGTLHRRGAEWAVISRGRHPLRVSSASGDRFRVVPPVVRVVNPIGCGDCLAAGIAWGIAESPDVEEAIRLGVGAATQNLQDLLPARIDIDTVRRFATGVRVEREPGR